MQENKEHQMPSLFQSMRRWAWRPPAQTCFKAIYVEAYDLVGGLQISCKVHYDCIKLVNDLSLVIMERFLMRKCYLQLYFDKKFPDSMKLYSWKITDFLWSYLSLKYSRLLLIIRFPTGTDLSMDCICGISTAEVMFVIQVSGRDEVDSSCRSCRTWSAASPSICTCSIGRDRLSIICSLLGGAELIVLVALDAWTQMKQC